MTARLSHGVKARALGVLAVAASPSSASAHDGQLLQPHDLWRAWTLEPWAIVVLAVSLGVYLAGTRRIASRRRNPSRDGAIRVLAFATGWVLLALSLLSPLHALGGSLLSAHMVQHEILMVVATPLLVLGRPLVPALWAASPAWRRSIGRVARSTSLRTVWAALTRPLMAALVHGTVIWVWHAPSLYEAGLRSETVHALQHIAFISTALLFWWAVLGARSSRIGEVVLALFITALHTGALGALLTFANSLWYPPYGSTTGPWGLSPLEDQQLAGLLMWIPGGAAYLIVALTLVGRWLGGPRRLRPRGLATAVASVLVIGAAGCRGGLDDNHSMRVAGGNPERGRIAISQYGCPACHVIPGIAGAKGAVGPPLTGIASRSYIGGVIENTPDNMVRWIMDPPRIDSLTAMPALGISEARARDIAEYLYQIR